MNLEDHLDKIASAFVAITAPAVMKKQFNLTMTLGNNFHRRFRSSYSTYQRSFVGESRGFVLIELDLIDLEFDLSSSIGDSAIDRHFDELRSMLQEARDIKLMNQITGNDEEL